ncbi:hypothetical protein vseg_011299 [Gypsophila vaccaria]
MKQTKAPKIYSPTTYSLVFLSIALLKSTSAEDQVKYLDSNCSEEGHYDQGSAFQYNLVSLFSNLSSEADTKNFYNLTTGDGDDKVYGLFLCNRIYVNSACQKCILVAKGEIQRRCPSSVKAIVWYTECMLRYANYNIFSINDVSVHNALDGGPPKYSQFNRDLIDTFISLSDHATTANSSSLWATTVVYVTKDISLSCYVDCTPDLSPIDCRKCLQTGLARVQIDGYQVGVLLQPSCRLMYAFSDAGLHPTGSGKGLYIALGIVSLTAAASLLMNIVTHLKHSKIIKKPTGLDEIETMESLHFEFNAIRSATDNFSITNKLGQGGFGSVYKGTLADGQAVAVKRLSNTSGQGIREFKTEACLAAKLQHKNLVKLFGFCLERGEMLLVYEYFANKSLDRHLFDPKRSAYLKWHTRYKIIVGIARGLLYLHEDSRPKIIHRDLKPSNILLDGEMNSKIADFGMAKLFGGDQTHGNTSRVAGTFGYMAPEYGTTGHFSVKSDIFSYGVILLEIVSGLRNYSTDPEVQGENLLNYAWRLWKDGNQLKLLDAAVGNDFSKDEVERCIHVGLLCIQEDPAKRPDTASVLFMLHTRPVTLPLPDQPPPFPYRPEKQAVSHGSYNVQADITLTELAPR